VNRLKLFILIFLVTISLPLTFVIYQSYSGLKQEERSQLSFFCATLIDQIEEDLARLVQAEETRSVDEYQHFLADSTGPGQSPAQLSPLADPAYQAYILGYLQNNPDGSMQTPLVPDLTDVPGSRKEVVTRLIKANEIFNSKKLSISPQPGRQKSPEPEPDIRAKGKAVFAERYLRKVTPFL